MSKSVVSMPRRHKSRSSSRSKRRRGCRRRSGRGKRRCSGKYGKNTNPFFNFLLSLKEKYKGTSGKILAVEGAKIWKTMDFQQKKLFAKATDEAQKKGGNAAK